MSSNINMKLVNTEKRSKENAPEDTQGNKNDKKTNNPTYHSGRKYNEQLVSTCNNAYSKRS